MDLNDDEIGAPDGSEPPLSDAHLTSLDADREVLRRRNVMTLRTLFSDDAVVERESFCLMVPLLKLDKQRGQSKVVVRLEQRCSHRWSPMTVSQ